MNNFQIGDRVKLVETNREGVIIGKTYGDIRYEVRCDNGLDVRDLRPEALRLSEEPISSATGLEPEMKAARSPQGMNSIRTHRKENVSGVKPVDPPELGKMPEWAKVLIGRARRENAVFTEQDMMMVWDRCGGRCAVTGLPFSCEVIGTGWAKKPFAPSFDKINRLGGYRPTNVRLVCALANFAMNAWGEVPFAVVCVALTRKLRENKAAWFRQQRAKIKSAERDAEKLYGEELKKARRRIAALKRNLTLGPGGLGLAARDAVLARISKNARRFHSCAGEVTRATRSSALDQ